MPLELRPLNILCGPPALNAPLGQGIAKHIQPALPLPELQEAPTHILPGFGEEARVFLLHCSGHHR